MNNKSYRIRTNVGSDKFIHVKLDQDYDVLEILSLRIKQDGEYLTHIADYGVIVGRVLANGGFGIPNAKLSVFIEKKDNEDAINSILYPYSSTKSSNSTGVRYNLLKDQKDTTCYQVVGTFPNKRFVLDNDNVIEVFETYYKFTTKTNDSGDYMFFGVPTGQQTIHMDLDLSDCGMLSQKPRDFLYKGYTLEQFENASQFKKSTDIDSLAQIFTQDQTVDVKPFWGDDNNTSEIGITRADISVNYKFEPTCIFLGSVFTDSSQQGFSRTCHPSKKMGRMTDLTTGSGTIEMIRKTIDGDVEEFQLQGTELIDGNGTWCYQIPMNLDYMKTDEYGNLVPTDEPEVGIATRTKVRFRISMGSEQSSQKYFQAKVLVPNNPTSSGELSKTYIFGTNTPESEFKDLFWNEVYSVKSYIPRLQKVHMFNVTRRTKRFTGIKTINTSETNSPIPYNHLRIKFPFIYVMICALIHFIVTMVKFLNKAITAVEHVLEWIRSRKIGSWHPFRNLGHIFNKYLYLTSRFCETMDGVFLVPGVLDSHKNHSEAKTLVASTYKNIAKDEQPNDEDYDGMANTSVPYSEIIVNYQWDDAVYEDEDDRSTIWGYFGLNYDNYGGENKYIAIIQTFGGGWCQSSFDEQMTHDQGGSDDSHIMLMWSAYTLSDEFKLFKICPDAFDYFKLLNKRYASDNINIGLAGSSLSYTIDEKTGKIYADWPTEDTHEPSNPVKDYVSAVTPYIETLIAKGFNDASSMENKGSATSDDAATLSGETQESDNTSKSQLENTVCLIPSEEYLMECIEMQLAEDYEVINFDFYNDWLNGSIYMPRWARKVKVRLISGKRNVKSCTDDAGLNGQGKSRKLYTASVGDTYFSSSLVAEPTSNRTRKMWKRGSFKYMGRVNGVIHHYVTNLGDTVYYYKPYYYNGGSKFTLFATDIILLGSLQDCDIFGIPAVNENIPATTFKLPSDLATTNFTDSDGGTNYSPTDSGSGCVKVTEIPKLTETELYNIFKGSVSGLSATNETEDEVPYTEEAGISWNYTGPNQVTQGSESGLSPYYYYSPGGMFLGLACTGINTLTNVKSTYNLIRACEYGVQLSEREEAANGNVYVVNGFIAKDNIYDNDFRSQFATMNYGSLRQVVINNATGYYKYNLSYMNPNNFDGAFQHFVDSASFGITTINTIFKKQKLSAWTYNGVVEIKDVNGNPISPGYSALSRVLESSSNDYLKFRYGGDSPLSRYHMYNNYKVIPQYENSFYFYFGLINNSTAIDRFRSDYFATCTTDDVDDSANEDTND